MASLGEANASIATSGGFAELSPYSYSGSIEVQERERQ